MGECFKPVKTASKSSKAESCLDFKIFCRITLRHLKKTMLLFPRKFTVVVALVGLWTSFQVYPRQANYLKDYKCLENGWTEGKRPHMLPYWEKGQYDQFLCEGAKNPLKTIQERASGNQASVGWLLTKLLMCLPLSVNRRLLLRPYLVWI